MDSAQLQPSMRAVPGDRVLSPGKLVFVTGGTRSGKSAFALSYALSGNSTDRPVYIATGQAMDPEFAGRIERHKRERSGRFTTIEESTELAAAFSKAAAPQAPPTCIPVVVDCITTWLGNLFFEKSPPTHAGLTTDVEQIENFALAEIGRLNTALLRSDTCLIVISNELGMGLVPADPTSRAYRDIHGRLNQQLAALAGEVWFLVSGIPWRLK